MEIARAARHAAEPDRAILESLSHHVRDAIASLQSPFYHQQARLERALALSREYARPENDIENSPLILE